MRGIRPVGVALCCVLVAAMANAAQTSLPNVIAGEHGVTDSGAATYSIPLRLPPGAVGLQPKLSLQYSSHGGNGMLGVGWSLGGLSAITRCPRTMAQDNVRGAVRYDADDRFCLDGQRLIKISAHAYGADAAEYRLERDPFTRILGRGNAQSNTSYFEVSRKSGELSIYGNSADSRIEAQGKSVPAVWALYRQIDINQNYLQWTYVEDSVNGAWYPQRVDYTGSLATAGSFNKSPLARVEFILEARPASDQVASYQWGSQRKLTQRIKQIKTYTDGNYTNLITDYRLSYDVSPSTGYSRVTSIYECAASGNCLPATSVSWLTPGGSSTSFTLVSSTPGANASPELADGAGWMNHHKIYQGDVNGDGRQDLISVSYDRFYGTVWLSNGTGFTKAGSFGDGEYLRNVAVGSDQPEWSETANKTGLFKVMQMDVNGDGRVDLVVRGNGHLTAWLSNGNTLVKSNQVADELLGDCLDYFSDENGSVCYGGHNAADRFMVMDINGDGRADILQHKPIVQLSGQSVRVVQGQTLLVMWLSNGNGFFKAGQQAIGSGYLDWFDTEWSYQMYGKPQFQVGDVDGDGRGDLIVAEGFYDESGGIQIKCLSTWLSNGGGFSRAAAGGAGWSTGGDLCGSNYAFYGGGTTYGLNIATSSIRLLDINGDGKADLVAVDPYTINTFSVFRSDGNSFRHGATTAVPYQTLQSGAGMLYGDINGDGMQDFYLPDTNQPYVFTAQAWVSNGAGYTHRGNISLPPYTPTQGNANRYFVMDVDGDGRDDLVVRGIDGRLVVWNPVGPQQDRVSQIDNGVGGQYQFEYQTLAQNGGAGVYAKGAIPAYPLQAVQAPYAVVKKATIAGAGTDSSTEYFYSNLQLELGSGRGLLGFESVLRQQAQAGRKTETTFHQAFPLTGLTKSVRTDAKNDAGTYVTVKTITNTQRCIGVDWTLQPLRSLGWDNSPAGCVPVLGRGYFTYLAQSVETGADLNGAALPAISTINGYDCDVPGQPCFGNLTSSTVSASDGHSKTSSFLYQNDLSRWQFGLPTRTTVQSNAPAWSGLGGPPPLQ